MAAADDRTVPAVATAPTHPVSRAGLTAAEAAVRLAAEGPNELPASGRRSLLRIGLDVVREPMFLLLIACGVVYLLLGDVPEALMLLGFVAVIIGITLYQERKTERAVEALRDLSSPRALVVRDGERVRVAGREVVRGDLVVLSEGDRVPADAAVVDERNLAVDESLLTGESVPVDKEPLAGEPPAEMGRPGGDGAPWVFSGTLVVRGQGLALVLATGPRTALGGIGRALESVQTEPTPLQRETGRLVGRIAVGGAFLCVLVAVIYALTRGQVLEGILAGIALAMAVLPEEFPVVLTVFLALGAWRIARRQVLTRRVPAVETLGAATVLCVDKTGTLTLNRMSVRRLVAGEDDCDLDTATALAPPLGALLQTAVLASATEPFDPMERALHHEARRWELRPGADAPAAGWVDVRDYPLVPGMPVMARAWHRPDGAVLLAAKGAPEAVLRLCGERDDALHGRVAALAGAGLRVLAVAAGEWTGGELPEEQAGLPLHVVGLVAFADPIRPSVPPAVALCHDAGIRVVVITGDYPGTARAIAREAGLPDTGGVLTGEELDAMDDAALGERVRDVAIFARVVPEQKLRIVDAFKRAGEVVAMTGDGVNDAPALKSAHIGIAMGGRGADVAREAADLVLLDDDFASIVAAVALGRRIFDNISKAMAYILAIHVPIAGLSLIPVLAGWPLLLHPVHIVFLELIIDPACSIVFEAEPAEADVMRRPPRRPSAPLFGRRTVVISVLQGTSVLGIVLAVYGLGLARGIGETDARALAFSTLILANLALIVTNRSWSRTALATLRSRNLALWLVVAAALTCLVLVDYVPGLQSLFRVDALHPVDLLLCVAGGAASVAWFELLKAWMHRHGRVGV